MKIAAIRPTVFLRNQDGHLEQLCRVTLDHEGPPRTWNVHAAAEGNITETFLGHVPRGESTYDVFLREISTAGPIEFELRPDTADTPPVKEVVEWRPPKHWRVHAVQLSHHDVGYTDLASNVLVEHADFLDAAIDMAANTRDFPEDARFRIVIEGAWSLLHFLRTKPPERTARMLELLRGGDIELAALFGNVTTELCGHETLARMLYPAFRLKREHGIPIVSAEHNDIPGISWGLCRVLADAGIRFFAPGLPLYYNWVKEGLTSFWDEAAVFGRKGPGAFWWESPSGKRVLFWCNNSGCGGDPHPKMPGLANRLQELSEDCYPFDLIRWPVQGAGRDNSPYIEDYAHTIRAWNEQWAFPHLVSSTNAKFFNEFIEVVPPDLPVRRGELPGQDYPIGASSTSLETALNRNTHFRMPAAEAFAAMASQACGLRYPTATIDSAFEEMLWHDEHTWGFHRPAHGPTVLAAQAEKAVHAHRAAALCDDVTWKAIARIADSIQREQEGLYLVVFNFSSRSYNGPISQPLREWDNCGSEIIPFPPGVGDGGYLGWVALTNRGHVVPDPAFAQGAFDLVDAVTGETVPYEIREIESPFDTMPYAGDRLGVSEQGHREEPFSVYDAARREFTFIAKEVPPIGYETYRMIPRETPNPDVFLKKSDETRIENDFYVVTTDKPSGRIVSIRDKELGIELVDSDAAHAFGSVVVRDPVSETEQVLDTFAFASAERGPVSATLHWTGSCLGHPRVSRSLTLYAGVKRIDFAVRILKDPTPLLDAHLAFPFAVPAPRFRYEGVLSDMTPIADYLPGSQSDRIAVQNWVAVSGAAHTVLWSSMDAVVASFARLWSGYVSPAHRCVRGDERSHVPLKPEDFDRGWIYSNLYNNNFQTNFAISQTNCVLFRYAFTAQRGAVSDADASTFGDQFVMTKETVFTDGASKGVLPFSGSLIDTGHPDVILLACKRAEDGNGLILRLWNKSGGVVSAPVKIPGVAIARLTRTSLAEENTGEAVPMAIQLEPREVATMRVELA